MTDNSNQQIKRDKMKETIDDMLRKSISSEHKSERDLFEQKAIALMVKWDLTERDLKTEDPITVHRIDYREHGNFALGLSTLYLHLADMYGGYGFYDGQDRIKGQRKGARTIVYATDSVIERVELHMKHLIRQLEYDCMMAKQTRRQAFSMGWAERVAARIKEQLEAAYSESMALVPTNSEAKQKANAIHNIGGNLNVGLPVSSYNNGIRVGNTTDIGNSKINT